MLFYTRIKRVLVISCKKPTARKCNGFHMQLSFVCAVLQGFTIALFCLVTCVEVLHRWTRCSVSFSYFFLQEDGWVISFLGDFFLGWFVPLLFIWNPDCSFKCTRTPSKSIALDQGDNILKWRRRWCTRWCSWTTVDQMYLQSDGQAESQYAAARKETQDRFRFYQVGNPTSL